MIGLLVRSEVWPDHSSLRIVPTEKVEKLMWFHHEPSDLVIWNEGQRVGHMRLHPKPGERDDLRLLEFSGNIRIRLPGSARDRISWDGVATFEPDMTLKSVLLGLGLREVSTDREEIFFSLVEKKVSIRLLDVSGRDLNHAEYTLDEAGLKKILAEVDLDPAVYDTFRPRASALPRITAQESSLMIHHERTKTFLVEIRQGGQTLVEAHVSELGQLLRVKTLIGYTLVPDDLMP